VAIFFFAHTPALKSKAIQYFLFFNTKNKAYKGATKSNKPLQYKGLNIKHQKKIKGQ
jgi:hypothetical protein